MRQKARLYGNVIHRFHIMTYQHFCNILLNFNFSLNPKVDTPPLAATVAAAAPLQLYQVNPVHQAWWLILLKEIVFGELTSYMYAVFRRHDSLLLFLSLQ